MKKKISFEGDYYEDRELFELLEQTHAFHCVLVDFAEYLRRKYKHDAPQNNCCYEEFESIRDKFWDLMQDEDIKLY